MVLHLSFGKIDLFLLQFATLNAQRAEVLKSIRIIGSDLYKIETAGKKEIYQSYEYLELIMPFIGLAWNGRKKPMEKEIFR